MCLYLSKISVKCLSKQQSNINKIYLCRHIFTRFICFVGFLICLFYIFNKTHWRINEENECPFRSCYLLKLWLRLDSFLKVSASASFREFCLLVYFRSILLGCSSWRGKTSKGVANYKDKELPLVLLNVLAVFHIVLLFQIYQWSILNLSSCPL